MDLFCLALMWRDVQLFGCPGGKGFAMNLDIVASVDGERAVEQHGVDGLCKQVGFRELKQLVSKALSSGV